MAFSGQVPGSLDFSKVELNELPSHVNPTQKSCYSYFQKVAALTNPLCLQHDTIFPNANGAVVATIPEHAEGGSTTSTATAVGCKGHLIDNEFPLESRTPFALPLVMYPSETNGSCPDEFDMCARPVLNWEAYMNCMKLSMHEGMQLAVPGKTNKKASVSTEELHYDEGTDVGNLDCGMLATGNDETMEHTTDEIYNEAVQNVTEATSVSTNILGADGRNTCKRVRFSDLKTILGLLGDPDGTKVIATKPGKRNTAQKKLECDQTKEEIDLKNVEYKIMRVERGNIPRSCITRFKQQPRLKVEGTWNHYFGGSNGACCFMKVWSINTASKQPCLFTSRGSRLRAVNLQEARSASMLSLKVETVLDETVPSRVSDIEEGPFADIIFQLLPQEQNGILGCRRGNRIDLFSVEDGAPYLLESVPNVLYGTKNYFPGPTTNVEYLKNPMLLGFDFSPDYGPELITIDENWVVRICDFTQSKTESIYSLPKRLPNIPPGYPTFKINEAVGVSFSHHCKIFYSWADSVVYLGDRRDCRLSRSQITTLFDIRKSLHSLALSEQNMFHENQAVISEYVSCVRRSENDPYFYVGTTSKIFLMDQRVPSRPVIKISHGLQSSLTYLDTYSDGNYETLVGASQRLPETVCMITDTTHMHCIGRSGCTAKNPILQSYPQHLSHPRAYFDAAGKEGFEFPMPRDYDLVKDHHYAWSTGLAVCPSSFKSDPKQPGGLVVATSNYFGDLFLQEWNQKPVRSHQKVSIQDTKLQKFMKEWQISMSKDISVTQKPESSKNKWKPADCSVIVRPITSEIEKLTRVRDKPFSCFKSADEPCQTLSRTAPIKDIMDKLKRYKGDRVTAILNIWADLETKKTPVEQVVIKEEIVLRSPSHDSCHTIEIDLESSDSDQMQTGHEEVSESSDLDQGQGTPLRTSVPNEESNDTIMQNVLSPNVDLHTRPVNTTLCSNDSFIDTLLDESIQQRYSQQQEDLLQYGMLTDNQEDLYGSQPSSSIQRTSRPSSSKRPKRSGFL